jgi:multidrug efflux pump subunit AcrA (membrane-fusion protein)
MSVYVLSVPLSSAVADTSSSTQTSVTAPSSNSSTPVSEERIVEHRGRYAPQTKIRIKNLLENIVYRGQATVERFAHISARIDSRIQKIKARGGDTSAAEAALAEADTARTAADNILRTLNDGDIDIVVDAPVPHDALRLLGIRIANAHANLTTAKDALARAARALSPTTTAAESHATTTATSSNVHSKK